MAILVNKSTGLAEVVKGSGEAELASGQYAVPMNDAQGNPVAAEKADLQDMLKTGHTTPSTDQLKHLVKFGQAQAPAQQAMTAIEQLGKAVSGGTSTAALVAGGVPAEDIAMREEANPGISAIATMGGLLAPSGAGAGIVKLGQGVRAALPATSFIGRVGTAAAAAAVENAAFQSGEEIHKMFLSDPSQSVGTAVADIGLAGIIGGGIGGGIGATSELWKLGPGKKVTEALTALNSRAAGMPQELKHAAGIEVAPELEQVLMGNKNAQNAFGSLREANTKAGKELQATVDKFHTDVRNGLGEVFGKTEKDLLAIENASDYEAGTALKKQLHTDFKATTQPVLDKYEELSSKFKTAVVSDADRYSISEELQRISDEGGFAKSHSEVNQKLIDKTIEKLPQQATAEDLRKYAMNLRDGNPFGSESYKAAKQIAGAMENLQGSVVERELATKSPGLMPEYQATKAAYREVKDLITELNDRLHVGKSGGVQSFLKNLSGLEGETVLRRLSPKGDVEFQRLLETKFPGLAQEIKQSEIDKLIKSSMSKKFDGLEAKKLFANIDKLSPEMRQFVVSGQNEAQLNALRQLSESLPERMNTSGTAKTLDKLWQYLPASAGAAAATIFGSNPAIGALIGHLSSSLGKEVPDAIKLAMLKHIATGGTANAAGFKAATEMASAVIKGEHRINKAIGSIFSAGTKLVSEQPSDKDRDKLKKRLTSLKNSPDEFMSVGENTSHYLPDHSQHLATTAVRAAQYLASIEPKIVKQGALNKEMRPSKVQEADYNRALDIAQNPLLVVPDIKNGTINLRDLQHLNAMYPELYAKISQKLVEEMAAQVEKDLLIPYRTKLGLSMFMQQPLDHSMSIEMLQSSQMQFAPMSPQQGGPGPMSQAKGKNLIGLPKQYATPQQTRELSKSTGHK